MYVFRRFSENCVPKIINMGSLSFVENPGHNFCDA